MGYHPLLDRERRFAAFWNPKCACTSLKYVFVAVTEGQAAADRALACDVHRYLRSPLRWRYFARGAAMRGRFRDFFKFIVVRSPWARLVSFYTEKSLWNANDASYFDRRRRVGSYGLTFRSFVHRLAEFDARELQPHLEPQARGLEDIEFDVVVKVEDPDAAMRRVGARIGVPGLALPRLNFVGERVRDHPFAADLPPDRLAGRPLPSYERFYDEALGALVAQIYAVDLARFGYAWEPAGGCSRRAGGGEQTGRGSLELS